MSSIYCFKKYLTKIKSPKNNQKHAKIFKKKFHKKVSKKRKFIEEVAFIVFIENLDRKLFCGHIFIINMMLVQVSFFEHCFKLHTNIKNQLSFKPLKKSLESSMCVRVKTQWNFHNEIFFLSLDDFLEIKGQYTRKLQIFKSF